MGDHFTNPLQGAVFRKFRAEIMNITDDLNMDDIGTELKVLKRGSRVNYTTRLILDFHRSVLGIVANKEGKIEL